jgi:hypothetical protein
MDLISREELLKKFQVQNFIYRPNNLWNIVWIEELIKNAQSVEIPQWIPCSERLPKYSAVYQITRKVIEGECAFYIADCAYFDGQNTWHSDNRVNHGREYLKDVIAWCPLQPAYKGD